MPRGGRRPGAGAPKGNLNALKHGRHSAHARKLLDALTQIPEARNAFLAFRRIHQRQVKHAKKTARRLFYQLLLAMPPQPDPKINQIIDQLQTELRKLHALPAEDTKILQKTITLAHINQTTPLPFLEGRRGQSESPVPNPFSLLSPL